jgi:hypothetical protein
MEKSIQLYGQTSRLTGSRIYWRSGGAFRYSCPFPASQISYLPLPNVHTSPTIPAFPLTARARVAPTGIKINFNHNRGRYSGVQKGPALPNFFNDDTSSDAYSFTRER